MQNESKMQSQDHGSDLPVASTSSKRSCCGMASGSWLTSLFAATTLIAIGVASYFAGQASSTQQAASNGLPFPLMDATAAVTSEKFSMATGAVSESVEGLFVLDHNSGLLQCTVIYPRSFQIGATYSVDVSETLATGGKGGKYMMVTGSSNFPSTNQRPTAPTVVYVLDTATGNYVCYGIPFNRTYVNGNRPQKGLMVKLATGTANPIADRDRP